MSRSVAVIILSWNGEHYLEKFLPSVVQHTPVSLAKIIVADNGSTDNSESVVKKYSSVEFLPLKKNYGFADGYNKAIEQTNADWIVLLNQDVEVTEGWLEGLLNQISLHPKLGACQPKILSLNQRSHFEYAGAAGGFLDKYGYPFCRGRIFDSIEEDKNQYNNETEIAWASGACMLVNRNAYLQAGGLDDLFFAHMEEIDLCWRLKNLDYEIRFTPASKVYHLGGGSLPQGNPRKVFLNFRNSLLMLYKNLEKHERGRIIFLRLLLDHIAAYRALFTGNFSDFRAIAKAHYHFLLMCGEWKKKVNAKNFPRKNHLVLPGFYNGSIVKKYFLQGKKIFSQL